MRSIIAPLLLVLLVAACAEPAGDPTQDPGDEPAPAEPAEHSEAAAPAAPDSPVTDVGILQTCTSDCLYPYNGVPVSCTTSGSCSAGPSSVTCGTRTTYCRLPPATTCEQNPAWSCTSAAQCDSLCGGPGSGICISSSACCVCL